MGKHEKTRKKVKENERNRKVNSKSRNTKSNIKNTKKVKNNVRDTKNYERNSNNIKNSKKKKSHKLRNFLIVLLIIVAILTGVIYAFIQDKLSKINYVELNHEELGISNNVKEGYRNIALFAVDSRNLNTNDGSRSDGIIVLSINEKTKDVKMVSVYRDTYVQVEGYGLTKITHAYAYGGPTLAIKTLNTNLDLNISEFVAVNFEAVANAIDAMGGVEIEITSEELPQMNKYISETSKITGIPANTLPKAGTYNLNGVQAVTYGRIRKTTGGDYKRTERMRTVIMKALNKAKTMDLGTLNKIIDDVLPKVQTNINSNDILGLASQIGSYNITDNTGWPHKTEGKTLDAWYGIPVTLESNVKQLHEELFEQEDYTVPETVKEISNKIINKTGYTE